MNAKTAFSFCLHLKAKTERRREVDNFGSLLVDEVLRRVTETLDYRAQKRAQDAYTFSRLIDSLDYQASYLLEALKVVAKTAPEEVRARVMRYLYALFSRQIGMDTANAAREVLREFVPQRYFLFADGSVAGEVQKAVSASRLHNRIKIESGANVGGPVIMFVVDPYDEHSFSLFLLEKFAGTFTSTSDTSVLVPA